VYLAHEVDCCHISCSSCIFVYLTHWSPSLLWVMYVSINLFLCVREPCSLPLPCKNFLNLWDHTWMNRSQCLFLQSRGAEIYAEFLGGSFTCDAYHMTEPHPDGIWGFPCSYSTWIATNINGS
jgi:hypothetical protein